MSSTEIIHSRLYKVEGVCYADEEAISQQDFDDLRDHYYSVVEALSTPWHKRNEGYDSTGRYNTGGVSEYTERF